KSADPSLPDFLVGVSIDQKVALASGKSPLLFNSGNGSSYLTGWSYDVNGKPLRYENSPCVVFDRLFGNFTPSTAPDPAAARQKLLEDRASVLDAVAASAQRTRLKLGRSDRAKLDQYLTQIRDVEVKLRPPVPVAGATCSKPSRSSCIYDSGTTVDSDLSSVI